MHLAILSWSKMKTDRAPRNTVSIRPSAEVISSAYKLAGKPDQALPKGLEQEQLPTIRYMVTYRAVASYEIHVP